MAPFDFKIFFSLENLKILKILKRVCQNESDGGGVFAFFFFPAGFFFLNIMDVWLTIF